jgi:hypothetical protein
VKLSEIENQFKTILAGNEAKLLLVEKNSTTSREAFTVMQYRQKGICQCLDESNRLEVENSTAFT